MLSVGFLWIAIFVIKNTASAQPETTVVPKSSTATGGYCSYDATSYDATSYNCSFSALTTIPDDIPADIQEVHLRGNQIQRIDKTFGSYTQLEVLDLSENRISEIDKGAFPDKIRVLNLTRNDITLDTISKERIFDNLVALEYLYMANNKIGNLTATNVFSYWMPEIKHLDLSDNQIEYLGHNVITDMLKLETMDLSRNQIRDPDASDFLGLKQLTLLNMTKNKMKHIPDLMFKGMEILKTVDLSDNLIESISKESFEEAEYLETLHLERNQIRSLPGGMCLHLKNLNAIYLDENPYLETIEIGSLTPMLKTLSVQKCKSLKEIAEVMQSRAELTTVLIRDNQNLAIISEYALGTGTKVDHVDLSHNALSGLSKHLLAWSNVTTANLAGNYWDCDCHMSWIKNLPESSPVLESLVCFNPLHLRGQLAKSLHKSQFSCSIVSRYRSHGAIAVAILFTSIVICLVALALHRFRYRICPSWYPVGKYETLFSSAEAEADDDTCQPVTVKKYTSDNEPVAV